jgi:hypothetical protein
VFGKCFEGWLTIFLDFLFSFLAAASSDFEGFAFVLPFIFVDDVSIGVSTFGATTTDAFSISFFFLLLLPVEPDTFESFRECDLLCFVSSLTVISFILSFLSRLLCFLSPKRDDVGALPESLYYQKMK